MAHGFFHFNAVEMGGALLAVIAFAAACAVLLLAAMAITSLIRVARESHSRHLATSGPHASARAHRRPQQPRVERHTEPQPQARTSARR